MTEIKDRRTELIESLAKKYGLYGKEQKNVCRYLGVYLSYEASHTSQIESVVNQLHRIDPEIERLTSPYFRRALKNSEAFGSILDRMAKNRMVNEEADCKGEHPDELWGITNYQNAEKCRKPKRNLPQGLLNAINEIKVRESRYDGYLMKHYTRNVDCYGNLNNANDFYRAVKRFENDLLNKRFKLRSQARDSGATEDEKKEIDARLEKDLELVKAYKDEEQNSINSPEPVRKQNAEITEQQWEEYKRTHLNPDKGYQFQNKGNNLETELK